MHWKDWCWSWNSNTLATWCEEMIHLKRAWCWERLKAGGEGDKRGWDGWMASPTQWTWAWVYSGRWWEIGRPGMLQSMGLQRVGQDWATELNWTELIMTESLDLLLLVICNLSLGQKVDLGSYFFIGISYLSKIFYYRFYF